MIFRDVEHTQNRACFGARMLNGSVSGNLGKEVPHRFYSWTSVESVV